MVSWRQPRRRVAIIVILALILIWPQPFLYTLSWLQRPLAAAVLWFSERMVTPAVQSLEAERNSLAVERAELESLRDENAALRQALQFVQRSSQTWIPAAVIARSFNSENVSFIVDRGRGDGLTSGSPVVTEDGLLVGKVVSINDVSATVMAITDRRALTAVSVLNQTRTIGLVSGMSTGLMSLNYIPRDETLAVNQLLVTSGLEDSLPAGLLVGIINSVNSESNAPFQEAIVEPMVDLRRVGTVLILLAS